MSPRAAVARQYDGAARGEAEAAGAPAGPGGRTRGTRGVFSPGNPPTISPKTFFMSHNALPAEIK